MSPPACASACMCVCACGLRVHETSPPPAPYAAGSCDQAPQSDDESVHTSAENPPALDLDTTLQLGAPQTPETVPAEDR
eukprot:2005752-Amphidinium_carterae.1